MEIIVSIILSVIQSILFYKNEIGISMIIFQIITDGTIFYILHKKGKIINKKGFLLIIPIILLSSTYFIYANKIFYNANICVLLILNALMFISITNKSIYFKNNLLNAFKLIINTVIKYKDGINYTNEKTKKYLKDKRKIDKNNIKRIIFSVFIVFIIVSIVIILLISADTIFASMFSKFNKIFKLVNIVNSFDAIWRFIIIIIIYFLFLNFMLKIQKQNNEEKANLKQSDNKNIFTIKLLLVTLNIVYLIFCYIQIKSLFAKVNLDEYFNYARYARSGFFQLMFVSLINFIIILISSKQNDGKERIIKILNVFLIIFNIIIVISSMYRMHMYEIEYGLTYLRTFAYIILVAELAIFIPTIIYIFNSKFDFIKWCSIVGLVIYCLINFMNIEKIIINKNINREMSTIPVDYSYISKIASEDSYDILEEKLKEENLTTEEKLEITKILLKISNNSKKNWQEFNISKAKILLKENNINNLKNEELKLENLIKQQNEIKQIELDKNKEYIDKKIINEEDILYEKYINSTNAIRVVNSDSVLGGKIEIRIQKTTNSGVIWYEQLKSSDSCMTVNNGAEFVFINENVGFINNHNLFMLGNENDTLLVTVNGGGSFRSANFIFPLDIKDNAFYIKEIPYLQDGKLRVQLFAPTNIGSTEGNYYEFESVDNGINWTYKDY